ncbi:MAG: hypothetical protein ACHRXM_26420 [Isosphaerales bacterium]
MNWHDAQRSKRASAARFDRDERARRRLEETPPANRSPEIPLELTETEVLEAAEAESRRLARLPWWERLSDAEKAANEAARKLSRYLSC